MCVCVCVYVETQGDRMKEPGLKCYLSKLCKHVKKIRRNKLRKTFFLFYT